MRATAGRYSSSILRAVPKRSPRTPIACNSSPGRLPATLPPKVGRAHAFPANRRQHRGFGCFRQHDDIDRRFGVASSTEGAKHDQRKTTPNPHPARNAKTTGRATIRSDQDQILIGPTMNGHWGCPSFLGSIRQLGRKWLQRVTRRLPNWGITKSPSAPLAKS
jgi:hypothetical protein